MRVRTTLLTRCLCVGLSLLAAATPVPAVAQEALTPLGGVAQPIAASYTDAERLAPPPLSDGVAEESQAGPTNPGDQTQGLPVSDALAALMAAQADADSDVSRKKWILIGVAAGMFVPSMLAVHLVPPPDPPATRLIGKTPEYTAIYAEIWKNRSHARRVKHAWIGVGIVWATVAGFLLIGCSTGGGCGAY